jgi:hypothetical protein
MTTKTPMRCHFAPMRWPQQNIQEVWWGCGWTGTLIPGSPLLK